MKQFKWRLLKKEPPVELFHDPPRGMILSEGAGAVLLAREGAVTVDAINAGGNFCRRAGANEIVRRILHQLADENACVVASANGTFVDLAECAAIEKEMPGAVVYSPKCALGESVGASAMWQTIVAAEALATKQLPKMSNPDSDDASWELAIVLSCGLNQQAAGLRLRMDSRAPIVSGLSI